jgi:hypothetical protein
VRLGTFPVVCGALFRFALETEREDEAVGSTTIFVSNKCFGGHHV